MTDIELVDILRTLNLQPKRCGQSWQCRCPVHDDRSPSLSARVTPEGKLLLYCHAGCSFMSVMKALGINGKRPEAPIPFSRSVVMQSPPSATMLTNWEQVLAFNARDQVEKREAMLGIPGNGLLKIGAAWSISLGTLCAPMMNGPGGQVIGVRLRNDEGKKWAMLGSRNGLFMPTEFVGEGPIYFPEGMTDTAAMVGLGLDAVGRPSCNGGRDLVLAMAKRIGRECVVVSDLDGPGIAGAEQLAYELVDVGLRTKIIKPRPGIKDVRAWVMGGADRATFEWAAEKAMPL